MSKIPGIIWTLVFHLDGFGEQKFPFEVSETEMTRVVQRFTNFTKHDEVQEDFISFETEFHFVSVRLSEILKTNICKDFGIKSESESQEDSESIMIHLLKNKEIISLDADTQDEYLAFVANDLEDSETSSNFYEFTDEDGESLIINRAQIALISIPKEGIESEVD